MHGRLRWPEQPAMSFCETKFVVSVRKYHYNQPNVLKDGFQKSLCQIYLTEPKINHPVDNVSKSQKASVPVLKCFVWVSPSKITKVNKKKSYVNI